MLLSRQTLTIVVLAALVVAAAALLFARAQVDAPDRSLLQPWELAPARVAARGAGVDPDSIRPLETLRLGPGELSVIVAGTDAAERTCLGFVLPRRPAAFYCPGPAGPRRLGPQAAFAILAYAPVASKAKPGPSGGAFVIGIARDDVDRVVVDQPPEPRTTILSGDPGDWGTFAFTLTGAVLDPAGASIVSPPRDAQLELFGATGLRSTVPLHFGGTGTRLLVVRTPRT